MIEFREAPAPMSEVVFFGPVEFVDVFRYEIVASAGIMPDAIVIANGTSFYTPNEHANPTIGTRGMPQAEHEVKISAVISTAAVDILSERLLDIHPYESFVIEVYRQDAESMLETPTEARVLVRVHPNDVERIRQTLSVIGVGSIGFYDDCSFVIQEEGSATVETIGDIETIQEAALRIRQMFTDAVVDVAPFTRPRQRGTGFSERQLTQEEADLLLYAKDRLNQRMRSETYTDREES